MKKSELLELLEKYPDDTRIEITVTDVDLENCKKDGEYWGDPSGNNPDLYVFGLPKGEYSYDPDEKAIALSVWSEKLAKLLPYLD